MNFYFITRILSYVLVVVGSVILTLACWLVYYEQSELYFEVVRSNFDKAAFLALKLEECSSNEWSEWTACNLTQFQNVSRRQRKNIACVPEKDSKPCNCPTAGTCKYRFATECFESVNALANLFDLQTRVGLQPFIIFGNSEECSMELEPP